MSESDVHFREMANSRLMLAEHFASDLNVYVTGNLLLYYEEGNPRRRVSPDTMVVRGVEKKLRRIYLLWEEGKAPNWVLEVTSRSTRRRDWGFKHEPYRQLGVEEYFLFDPLGEYLRPRLQAYRLHAGEYVPLARNEAGRLRSDALGLELAAAGTTLRFYDPATGQWLLSPDERAAAHRNEQAARREAEIRVQAEVEARRREEAGRREADARAQAEAEARREAEAEAARLRDELARLRGEQPGRLAE